MDGCKKFQTSIRRHLDQSRFMASDDFSDRWRQLANPALGLDNVRLTSQLFRVFGTRTIDSVRLPSDPALSQTRRTRQFLLRLEWILEAFQPNCIAITTTTSSPPLDGLTSLRVLLYVLKVCSLNELHPSSEADYGLWRHIALNAIITATRTFLLSKHPTNLEEEDLVSTALENLCNAWSDNNETSAVEKVLLQDIIPQSLAMQNDSGPRTTDFPEEMKTEDLISEVSSIPRASKELFWAFHDRISRFMWSINDRSSTDCGENFNFTHAKQLLLFAQKELSKRGVYRGSEGIIRFQMERLASVLQTLRAQGDWNDSVSTRRSNIQHFKSTDRLQVLLDRHLSLRKSRIINMEREEFCRSFLVAGVSCAHPMPNISPDRSAAAGMRQVDELQTTIPAGTMPVELASDSFGLSLLSSNTTSLVSLQAKSTLFPEDSDQTQTDTALHSRNADLDQLSVMDSAPKLKLSGSLFNFPRKSTSVTLIPTPTEDSDHAQMKTALHPHNAGLQQLSVIDSVPKVKLSGSLFNLPHKSTSVTLIPTPTEDNISLSLQDTISSPDYYTDSFELDLDTSSSLDLPPNEKAVGRTKSRMSNLIKSVVRSTHPALPSNLDFCFSGAGDRIAVWSKEIAESVILINPQSNSGLRYMLDTPTLPQYDGTRKKIRHLHCSNSTITAIIQIENVRPTPLSSPHIY